MLTKPLKPKSCKACRVKFTSSKPLASVCSFECAIAYANVLSAKKSASEAVKYRKALAERKEKLKSRQQWLKEAQTIFNIYIRKRDEKLPCISCDKPALWDGQWHASHYRSVGACPALRFNEQNVHKSCSVCNNWLSSNSIEYRKRLIHKIGISRVYFLESEHEAQKYTIDEIKEIKAKYKKLIAEMKK